VEEYWQYLLYLNLRIPDYIYEGGLLLFIIGLISILCFYGFNNGLKKIVLLVFIEYCFLLFCSTVIFRDNNIEAVVDMKGFVNIFRDGNYYHVPENLMNIIVFVPIGILSCSIFRELKWWNVLIFGTGLSLSIEILQLLLKRGTTEFADVLNNTLGCLIGFMIVAIVKGLWSLHKRFSMN